MVFLGTEKGWREPRCLVTLALLCLTALLHVDVTTAIEEGECHANNTCPAGFCCSKDGFCGTTDEYCGFGCKGGPCNDGSPSNSLIDLSLGACISDTCAPGFCCSKDGFCGTTDKYCGFGCRSGPCNSSSGGKGLSTGATGGIVVASVVVLGGIMWTIVFVARRITQRNRTGTKNSLFSPMIVNTNVACSSSSGRQDLSTVSGTGSSSSGRQVFSAGSRTGSRSSGHQDFPTGSETGSSSSSPKDVPPGVKMLNDSLYEMHVPSGRPEVDIIFFHGLTIDNNYKNAYWKTWSSDGTPNTLWPRTFLGELSLPGARILAASYDSSVKRTSTSGRGEMYLIGENLVHDIILLKKADVGRGKRPVILVGHSLGGLIIKQFLLEANHKKDVLHRKRKLEDEKPFENFLSNVCGIFYYATPHNGTELADVADRLPGSSKVLRRLKTLSKNMARFNEEFREWRTIPPTIPTFSIAEDCETQISLGDGETFNGVIVTEASARMDTDHYYTGLGKSHFDVCQHEDMKESSFQCLVQFITDSVWKWDPTYTLTKAEEDETCTTQNRMKDA